MKRLLTLSVDLNCGLNPEPDLERHRDWGRFLRDHSVCVHPGVCRPRRHLRLVHMRGEGDQEMLSLQPRDFRRGIWDRRSARLARVVLTVQRR